jgi:hypothetical protein
MLTRPAPFVPRAALLLTLALTLAAPPAVAQSRAAAGPKSIGTFQDWQAATHGEGAQRICYAATRATGSKPALAGRGDVLLTVTHRSNLRDAVSVGAGFAYGANAEVKVEVGQATFDFYTAQRAAFARNGAQVVSSFARGAQAVAKSPHPRGEVVDSFSLKGFSAAYAAISKACPGK